ncbi:MAG: tRNA dihydrouridine synthase DusB [Lachnospiraceae bacterium]|nr:tRNA dihydrouridine synthase DusB [Lachnospiraceae bacterium]
MRNRREEIPLSFHIGTIEVSTPLALGPMAGVTDLPFRLLCKEQGAGLLYTEMVSAKGVMYRNPNTAELIATEPAEQPIGLQLFGADPTIMSEQAKVLEEKPFAFFDVNMGCPVPKVVNNGEGSSLMKDPKLVYDIVYAMVRAQSKPVTVKIRRGFGGFESAAEVAKAAEDAGVSMVAVHGRFREEYYSGHSDWGCIRRVKEAVTIPVIGSGDVTCAEDAAAMMRETGCDGVMIARAARGNPWIFAQCGAYLSDGTVLPKPDDGELCKMVLRHARMACDFKGEFIAMKEMRSHVAWYFAGRPGSAGLRRAANEIATYEGLEKLIGEWLEAPRFAAKGRGD